MANSKLTPAWRREVRDRRAINALLARSGRRGAYPFTLETDNRGETVAVLSPVRLQAVRS